MTGPRPVPMLDTGIPGRGLWAPILSGQPPAFVRDFALTGSQWARAAWSGDAQKDPLLTESAAAP
jgi:hypothetical protein